tara:strand:+ start:167 stop:727 length:561 start_codon:yes stop_codon:yes gene_type:complete
MIRIFDFFFALFGLIILMPLILLIFLLLLFENKSPLFFQKRIGKNLKAFTLIKFRTMNDGTKDCPTHLVDSSRITTIGALLRKTKMDEIPQLWNVLKGEMTIVGPRPCLPSQINLIQYRRKLKVHKFLPGITGLAQIKGIDMSNPLLLAKTELKMMQNFNLKYYLYLIIKTIMGNGLGDRVNKKDF